MRIPFIIAVVMTLASLPTWAQVSAPLPVMVTPTTANGCLPDSICPSGNWAIDFDDEFNGSSVDWSKWYQAPVCGISMGDSNNNVTLITVSGGTVHIHGYWNNSTCSNRTQVPGQALDTIQSYGPGYFEARMQEDPQGGTHGAFWTLGGNGNCVGQMPAGFEGDIDEFYSGAGSGSTNVHWGGYSGCHQSTGVSISETPNVFHIYGMLYDAVNGVTFYLDGSPGLHVNQGCSASTPCAVPLGIEFGESGGDGTGPGLQVDWVRHYVAH